MRRLSALLALLVVVGCATTQPHDSASQMGWSIARPSQLAHVMPDSTYQLLRALPADSLTVQQRAQLAEEDQVRARLERQMDPAVKTLIVVVVFLGIAVLGLYAGIGGG